MKPTIVPNENIEVFNKKFNTTPFVKWVGGKRQIMDELKNVFKKIEPYNKYHEPFVGGGAVFINMLNSGKKVSSINDLNSELINAYKVVKTNPEELIKQLKFLQENHSKFQYYYLRKIDRDKKEFDKLSDFEKAARLIYLNKTGFNGIYRVNSKNHFNVPIGNPWRVNLSIFDENNIRELSSQLIKNNVSIFNKSYENILDVAHPGDLVYFDPPYDSFENEVSFVGYQKEGFTRSDQEKLKDVCDRLVKKGVRVVVSNHNTGYIRDLYSSDKYYILEVVSAGRSVNRDSSKRSKEEIEVIIYDKREK